MGPRSDHGNEKRQFERRKIETVTGVSRTGTFSFEGIVEISEGGVLLRLADPYQVGDIVEISCFMPPSGDLLSVQGEVAYTLEPSPGNYYAGVRFLNVSAFTSKIIRAYVASCPP